MIEQLLAGKGIEIQPDTAPTADGGAEPAVKLVGGQGALTLSAKVDEFGNLCLSVWGAGSVAVWVQSDLVLGGHEYEGDDE
jgi:hypothetical protein